MVPQLYTKKREGGCQDSNINSAGCSLHVTTVSQICDTYLLSPKQYHLHSEEWRQQHQALGPVFLSWSFNQGGGNKKWLDQNKIKVLNRPSQSPVQH